MKLQEYSVVKFDLKTFCFTLKLPCIGRLCGKDFVVFLISFEQATRSSGFHHTAVAQNTGYL